MAGGGASGKDAVIVKAIVIGDPATGKTSLIKRAVYSDFPESHRPTVGVDFNLKTIVVDGKEVKLQLWDIAGQDRFGTIYRIYYKDSFGALIVFDLTDKSTFQSVERWKSQVDSKVKLPGGEPLPVILVANKCDLKDRAIDTAILDDYCREHGFAGWIETSAKDNINVDEAFQMLVREILKHPDAFEAQKAAKAARAKDAAAVDLTDAPAAASGGCC